MIIKSFSRSIPRLVSIFVALSLHLSNSGANETFVVQAKQAKLESLLPTAPEEEVKSTILNAINTHEDVIGFIVFDILVDDVKISSDGRWATARLYFLDKTNLEKIPGEPSLALGEKFANQWLITLQADRQWNAVLNAVPSDLLSDEEKSFWKIDASRLLAESQIFGGYKLPWPGGQSRTLYRSVTHPEPEQYAYDFGEGGNQFELRASKGGVVWFAQWAYPDAYNDGNCNHANYLVIKDPGTSPETFVIYLHLKQNSIPSDLRIRGAVVRQGQMIGFADDTGCSSTTHLHIQVHTNTNSWYGTSQDMTFDDVAINGGRPRTPAEASVYGGQGQTSYTSQNYSSMFYDEFNSSALNSRWHWYMEDPTHWSLTASPGYLRIITQSKDIYSTGNNAPLLLQALQLSPNADFDIQTRIKITATANFHQGGLVVYSDYDNYVRFTYAYIDGPKFEFIKEIGANPQPIQVPAPSNINDFHLRIARRGTNYFAYYSQDGANWTVVATHLNVNIAPLEIGLLAFNGVDWPSTELPADFDYFRVFPRVISDGSDTVGVFRPSNGVIFLKNTNETGYADVALNYGIGGDYPVTGDWNGDGKDTIGVYRNGVFYLRNSNTVGIADVYFTFGAPGDQPIAGDWNDDGVDTVGVYRSSNFTFYLRNSNSAGAPDKTFSLGIPGDIGIAGDWTGKGFDTTGVFRPSNGVIFLKNANSTGYADIAINYGMGGDKPITGDWNNDGTDTIGILRGNVFYLRNSNTVGYADLWFALGINGDMPIAGNWDALP